MKIVLAEEQNGSQTSEKSFNQPIVRIGRDPVEWAQHTALVAISVFRTVLDLAEAAVADRERLD